MDKQAVGNPLPYILKLLSKVKPPVAPTGAATQTAQKAYNTALKAYKSNVKSFGTGVGSAIWADQVANSGEHKAPMDRRLKMGLFNLLAGTGAGKAFFPAGLRAKPNFFLGSTIIGALPIKDLAMNSMSAVNATVPYMESQSEVGKNTTKALEGVSDALKQLPNAVSEASTSAAKQTAEALQGQVSSSKDNQKLMKQIAIATLLTGGTLGAAKLFSDYSRDKDRKTLDQQGNIKITLPTKRPGDVETQVSIPMGNRVLSNNVRSQIERDIRRRARAESKERVQHRADRMIGVTE